SQGKDRWMELKEGADERHDGSTQIKDGNNQVKDCWTGLTDGTIQIDDGLLQVVDGSAELKEGLMGGAEQAGALDPNEANIAMFAQPVEQTRSEEHTSELQSRFDLVCRLLLEKKNK